MVGGERDERQICKVIEEAMEKSIVVDVSFVSQLELFT
jgi:hypothetical protein